MTFHSLPQAPLLTGAVIDGANGLQQLNEHGVWEDETQHFDISSRKPRSKPSPKRSSQIAAKRAEIARLRLDLAEAELTALEEGDEDGSQDWKGPPMPNILTEMMRSQPEARICLFAKQVHSPLYQPQSQPPVLQSTLRM